MTMIRMIGDTHGKLHEYGTIVGKDKLNGGSIQVGDFGVGFISTAAEEILYKTYGMDDKDRFIRGNHDDPDRVQDWKGYIPDGHHDEELDIYFIGGADSIDKGRRTPGLDWWYNEQCPEYELEEFVEEIRRIKPRVMVTHDCPQSIANQLWLSKWGQSFDTNRTRLYLEKVLEVHRPEYWFFGHWHRREQLIQDGTYFICLEELGVYELCL